MTVNEKGLEAALSSLIEGDAFNLRGLLVNLGFTTDEAATRVSAAIEAYLRAASKDAEPVAWTSPGNLDGLKDHDSLVIGSMCNRQGDGWTVPLFTHPSTGAEGGVRVKGLTENDMHIALTTAYRRMGGVAAIARSQGGSAEIIEIAVREIASMLEAKSRSPE